MSFVERIRNLYGSLIRWTAPVEPVALVLLRVWVAMAFWRAGVVKFDDPYGTAYLFQSVYHVPLLPAGFAAMLGTWIELTTPWLLGLGILTRPTAAFLFIYNIICVISYPDLWPHGFWRGLIGGDFVDHKVWGIMLLMLVARGAGVLSVDAALSWVAGRKRHPRPISGGQSAPTAP